MLPRAPFCLFGYDQEVSTKLFTILILCVLCCYHSFYKTNYFNRYLSFKLSRILNTGVNFSHITKIIFTGRTRRFST
jgi:hypothetical protein